MTCVYMQTITTQPTIQYYQQNIVTLIFSIGLLLSLMVLFFLISKTKYKALILFLLITTACLCLYKYNYKNKIKYKIKNYETYNQYIITKKSDFNKNKYKIVFEDNEFIKIEDIHHKQIHLK